jgi:hypothetical protein
MILGTESLYITANVVNTPYVMQTFSCGACVVIGGFVGTNIVTHSDTFSKYAVSTARWIFAVRK